MVAGTVAPVSLVDFYAIRELHSLNLPLMYVQDNTAISEACQEKVNAIYNIAWDHPLNPLRRDGVPPPAINPNSPRCFLVIRLPRSVGFFSPRIVLAFLWLNGFVICCFSEATVHNLPKLW